MSAHAILELPGTDTIGGASPFHRLRLLDTAPIGVSNSVPVLMHSLSTSGILLETAALLRLGQPILVILPKGGPVSATIVWNSDKLFVCRFGKRISRVRLRAAPSPNPLPAGLEPEPISPVADARQFVPGRMQHHREKQGMSRLTLAARTGVSTPTIWAWEIGRKIPRPANLVAVARALNVSEWQLMRGDSALADGVGGVDERSYDVAPGGDVPVVPDGADALRGYIKDSKQHIAALAGVDSHKVKVSIEY